MKKQFLQYFVLIGIAIGLSGCAKSLMVSSIDAGDKVARGGETVELKTMFEGKVDDIQKVEMIVREFPYDAPPIIFEPVDENDEAWSNKLAIPYQTPPGTYHLELKVTLKDGTQLITEGNEDNAYGKAGVVAVKVE